MMHVFFFKNKPNFIEKEKGVIMMMELFLNSCKPRSLYSRSNNNKKTPPNDKQFIMYPKELETNLPVLYVNV